ncbi:unnamed protein product [Ectocarpus fasciculatus]
MRSFFERLEQLYCVSCAVDGGELLLEKTREEKEWKREFRETRRSISHSGKRVANAGLAVNSSRRAYSRKETTSTATSYYMRPERACRMLGYVGDGLGCQARGHG